MSSSYSSNNAVCLNDGYNNIIGVWENPMKVDIINTVPQPINDNNGSITIDSTQLPSSLAGGKLDINIGSWLSSAVPTIGQKTMSNSIPVVISSDQSAIPISGTVTANAGTGSFTVAQATAGNLNATVVGSGNFTVVQGTAANLRAQTASEGGTAATTPTSAGLSGGAVTTAAPTYTTGQMNALSLTTGGLLRVDSSGTTQPVSGTVTANAGTGTFTTQDSSSLVDNAGFTDGTSRVIPSGHVFDDVAGTALTENDIAASRIDSKRAQVFVIEDATTRGQKATVTASNALKVDGSAVTQPVSGTVTANAGTGSFTVAQVTAANLNATIVGTGTDNTANVTTKLPVIAARVNTSAPTWSDGNMAPLSVDTSGALRITGNISASNPSVSATGSAPPASATYLGGSVTTAAPSYTTGQMSGLSLTIGGLLRVDGSGVTQPVSGTVAATQSGTWTVQPGNTANTTPWLATISQGGNAATVSGAGALKVDGSAVTQPVSGTITANIGTVSTLVLDATVAKLTIASGTALGSNTSAMVAGSVTTAAPTYTTGQINPLSLTTAGALRVDSSAVTQPVSGTVTVNAGTGTFTTQDGSSLVDNAGFTDGASRIFPNGYIFDEVAGTALTENDIAASRIDSKRALVNVIEDATNRGIRATVKAASTAAVATDTALVVALSPNNSIVVAQGSTTSGQSGQLVLGAVTTAAPTYTTAQSSPLSLSVGGGLRAELQPTTKTTYSGAARNITPPATPTDIVTITGSATKTVRVTRVILSTTQTTAGINEFFLVKRSAANTAGTSTSPTIVAYDSTNAAATATVLQYSANPTPGAAVGNIQVLKLLTPAAASGTQPQYVCDFTNGGITQGIVLRGTTQVLALNFNGAALPSGLNVACTFEWTEE